jgi:EpsI family protein
VIGQRHALWLTAVLLGAAIAYAHWPALVGMKAMWDNTPMYSFGYIVPAVSVFLIWSRRQQLATIDPRPAVLWGSAVALVTLALLLFGRVGGVLIAEQLAFVLALVAGVLLVFGTATLRAIWVALAYLLLMVPFWDAFTEPLHLPFQQLSATLGIRMLQTVGIPAYREGVMLYLPNITLEVARACSGVNYLVAILALGIPLSYLYLPTLWRRVLLVSFAIVVAALSNSLRVALIGVLAYYDIGAPLHGPGHVLHGLFVSGIGYVVLLVGLRWLRGAPPDGALAVAPPVRAASGNLARLGPGLALALTFLLATVSAGRLDPSPVPLAQPLAALPDPLGPWSADFLSTPVGQWWQSADDEVRRRYRRPGFPHVDVEIAYFSVQRQDKELASHLSAPLHRALATTAPPRDANAYGGPNIVRLQGADGERLGIFWYEIDGQIVTSAYMAKARTMWNAFAHGRSNGAMVVLISPVEDPAMRDAQIEATGDLAARVHRALQPLVGQPTRTSSAR